MQRRESHEANGVVGAVTDAIASRSIGEWFDALAAEVPTPGGGAFAAIAGAGGAALVAMTARLTVHKAGFEAVTERMQQIIDEADEARVTLTDLADRDGVAFDRAMAAYKLPKDSDDKRTARLLELQAALEGAAEVPLTVARRAVYVMGLAEEVTENGNPNAASDGLSGAAALHAATVAALANVQINAFAFTDQVRRGELMDDVRRLRDRADALLADVDEAFRARVTAE